MILFFRLNCKKIILQYSCKIQYIVPHWFSCCCCCGGGCMMNMFMIILFKMLCSNFGHLYSTICIKRKTKLPAVAAAAVPACEGEGGQVHLEKEMRSQCQVTSSSIHLSSSKSVDPQSEELPWCWMCWN